MFIKDTLNLNSRNKIKGEIEIIALKEKPILKP